MNVIPFNAISTNRARGEFYVIIYNSGENHLSQTVYLTLIYIMVMLYKYLITNIAHASTNTQRIVLAVALKGA